MHRYIHCLFDIKSKIISHLDGAILSYDEDSHKARNEITLEKNPRY